ncbi:MAG: penicillin-binding protein activator [Myxococcota bacterium]|nr:penicillin-binding protein activator [Myxococcota bacterium]
MRNLSILLLGIGLTASSFDAEAKRPSFALNKIVSDSENDREAAKTELKAYINSSGSRSDREYAMLYLGELQRLDQMSGKARFWFQKVIDEFPTSPHKHSAQVGLLLVQAQEDTLSGNGLAVLQLHIDLDMPDSMKADQFRILTLNASSVEIAQAHAKSALKHAQDIPDVFERVKKDLHGYLDETTQLSNTNEEALLTQIIQGMNNGVHAQVISLSTAFLTQYPESEHHAMVTASQKRAEAGDPYDYQKVGVLLPMTGDYAYFSTLLKGSLEYAAKDSSISLVWFDTEGQPELAAKGVEQLTTEDGCSIILGPLLRETAPSAAEAAQAYQIPMITFSQSDAVTESGEFIFRGFVSTSDQVKALLDHAVDVEGWKRYTILAPETRHGREVTEIFKTETTSRGAEVIHSVLYDPEGTAFLEEARTLAQREDEDDETVIDIDAFFIPDTFRVAPLVASSLAYEEFPIGNFRTAPNVKPLGVMGLNGWNHPDIVKSGGKYLQNGLFVDAFWAQSNEPEVKDFVNQFAEEQGRKPSIYDAMAIDTIKFVVQSTSTVPGSRSEHRNTLQNTRITHSITGGIRFTEDRVIDRNFTIFTVGKDGITEWSQ